MSTLPEYLCPVCQFPLLPPSVSEQRQWSCHNRHGFDAAKQGYLNLLLPQQKRSRAPGDTPDMVKARTDFLDTGRYQPLANALSQAVAPVSGATQVLLDIGCGEGYYTTQLAQLDWRQIYGLDISKPAIVAATRRTSAIHWSVASMRAIPLAAQSVDAITCVFAYYHAEEVLRVLKPDGRLVLVVAGPDHLLELRQAIYPELRPQEADKALNAALPYFDCLDEQRLDFYLTDLHGDALWNLLQMTPHFWRASPAVQTALRAQGFARLRVQVQILTLQPKPAQS